MSAWEQEQLETDLRIAESYNSRDDFRKSIDYIYQELRQLPRHQWPAVLTRRKDRMSELGNLFEGTAPPLPLQNGPEPAPKKRGRPKGWKKATSKVAKAKPVKAKRGGRRTGMSPNVARKSAIETVTPVQAPPSFAGSDNIAGLLASLDPPDVQLFFDMYRAINPRDPEDRRTIVAALQASFV